MGGPTGPPIEPAPDQPSRLPAFLFHPLEGRAGDGERSEGFFPPPVGNLDRWRESRPPTVPGRENTLPTCESTFLNPRSIFPSTGRTFLNRGACSGDCERCFPCSERTNPNSKVMLLNDESVSPSSGRCFLNPERCSRNRGRTIPISGSTSKNSSRTIRSSGRTVFNPERLARRRKMRCLN